jgi:hypothetical protein
MFTVRGLFCKHDVSGGTEQAGSSGIVLKVPSSNLSQNTEDPDCAFMVFLSPLQLNFGIIRPLLSTSVSIPVFI